MNKALQKFFILERDDLDTLFSALKDAGFDVVGPTLGEGAIVYDSIGTAEDLPIGWTEEQEGGAYRLKRRDDRACFGFTVGPHSWKKYLHPPSRRLWSAANGEDGFEVMPEVPETSRYAFIGVRSCEIHAIRIQDRVFLQDRYVNEDYRARREGCFIVAVQCAQAANTCFCVSMNTGPRADDGFDLALTEMIEGDAHRFLVEVGSDAGEEILGKIPVKPASPEDLRAGERIVAATEKQMGRTLDTQGVRELLANNQDHSRWDQVASRCLSCANCTMVCPTCFCTTVEDVTDITGDHAERWQRWDSCFTMDFSYLHGGSVRASTRSRYRQWLTHKLSSWVDQFESSGCVGCGRCITWCPVAIDLTEEVSAIRSSAEQTGSPPEDKGHDHEKS